MKAPALPPLAWLALGLAAWAYVEVTFRGGLAAAASDLGAGAVGAVGGVASGAVGAVGGAFGLPTPAQTITDERVARWIIDHHGYLTASIWAGAPALFGALGLPAGSGLPPAAGTPAALALGVAPLTAGDFARMDRLEAYAPWAPSGSLGAPGWEGMALP